jgi:hypothetical protein
MLTYKLLESSYFQDQNLDGIMLLKWIQGLKLCEYEVIEVVHDWVWCMFGSWFTALTA